MSLVSAYLYMAANSNWLWLILLAVTLFWLYMRLFVAFYDTNMWRTDNANVIITGAESGIGKMTADLLAARGGRIIMACKDMALGQAAREYIVKRTCNEKVEVRHLDLSSLESVRKFAKDMHGTLRGLDVLINNASEACAPNDKTADGLNAIMQANHFGPFLLTNLLLDLIKKSTPSRVVFLTSVSHHLHKFSLENVNCDKEPLHSCRVYFNSKLASILTAKHFAHMLQGTGVTVNTVNPGMTEMDPTEKSCSGSIMGTLYSGFLKVFGKTLREGAMTSTYAATEPKLTYVTGTHFSNCKISHCIAKMANDRDLQEKLFEKSAQLVLLRPDERHL